MRGQSIALLTLLLILPGCGRLAAGPDKGNARQGAVLYVKYGCLQCHGINGHGPTDTKPAHDLTNDLSEANYALLHYYLIDQPPTDMSYTKSLPFSRRQFADLIAFENSNISPPSARKK